MIVVLTDQAERELEAIGDYIAADNPVRAISFTRELRGLCLTLADHPERLPLVPRFEPTGVRHRVSGNYALFYRVDTTQIVVLHILHSARDYEAILSA